MSWNQARRKLFELTSGRLSAGHRRGASLRGVPERLASASSPAASAGDDAPRASDAPPPGLAAVDVERRVDAMPDCGRARSVCVASGKGGTGKTVLSASLAHLFSRHGRTLVVDADLGVGNAHILQNVTPQRSFVDVVEGEVPVREVVVPCGPHVDLLAAGSGVPRMSELSSYELHLIASGLEELERDYGTVVVDAAAGLARQTLAFARSCDEVLLVTTPDLTAMTDAYAFLKVLTGRAPGCEPLLLVNRARSEEEADEVAERIGKVSRRFLGRAPRPIGWVPEDPLVKACVNRRGAVAALEPASPAGRAIARLAAELERHFERGSAGGVGRRLLESLSGGSSRSSA